MHRGHFSTPSEASLNKGQEVTGKIHWSINIKSSSSFSRVIINSAAVQGGMFVSSVLFMVRKLLPVVYFKIKFAYTTSKHSQPATFDIKRFVACISMHVSILFLSDKIKNHNGVLFMLFRVFALHLHLH